MPGSAMSGLVKHYTSEKLHQLLMDSTENREELREMRKALEKSLARIESRLGTLQEAKLKAAVDFLQGAMLEGHLQYESFK